MKKIVNAGGVMLGGGSRVAVQTMTNTKTSDIDATAAQINRCAALGADLVRLAIQNKTDAQCIIDIKKRVSVPLIADIQFDYRLAISSIENGIDKIRINPGNISKQHLNEIVAAAREHSVPIRVGVNSGSLDKDILSKYGLTAEALTESCLLYSKIFEELNFNNLVLAVKSSDVRLSVEAYRLLNSRTDYPLHIGITEAGTRDMGLAKSYAGLGALLIDGIGDTIRISLTDKPENEVVAAHRLLRALKIEKDFVEVVSCPTCSRCNIDIEGIASEIEAYTASIKKPLKVAVMGCVVNGPGEARDADLGLAGGDGKAVIFKKGEVFHTVDVKDALRILKNEIDALTKAD